MVDGIIDRRNDMRKRREPKDLTHEELNDFAVYMNDDVRERVHNELAPCEPAEFFARYCELDPSFEEFLEAEMGFFFD